MINISVRVRNIDKNIVARKLPTALVAVAEAIKAKINVYPGPPRYPLHWQSLRQKRYVLTTIQVPYRRGSSPTSQRLSASWYITREGFDVVLASRATYAQYVVGDRQQVFHRDTGWHKVSDVVKAAGQDVANVVKSYL